MRASTRDRATTRPVRRLLRRQLRGHPWRGAARVFGETALMVAPLTVSDLLGRFAPLPEFHEAAAHAWRVLHVEHTVGLDIEHLLVRAPSAHPTLFSAASDYYASMHFVVTTLAALAVATLRPSRWAVLRTSFVIGAVSALVISRAYPVVPPNLLGAAAFSGVSDASHPPNAYAAMPSTHTFWAVWSLVALAVAVRPRRRAVRIPVLTLGAAHLVTTVLVLLSIGHHTLLDVAAGAALVGASSFTAALLHRSRASRGYRAPGVLRSSSCAGRDATPVSLSRGPGHVARSPSTGRSRSFRNDRTRRSGRREPVDEHGRAQRGVRRRPPSPHALRG